MNRFPLVLVALASGAGFCTPARAQVAVKPAEARAIAKEAYIYGYPLLAQLAESSGARRHLDPAAVKADQVKDTAQTAHRADVSRRMGSPRVHRGGASRAQF